MLHITCDHCGRSLEAGEARFVLRVEVFTAPQPIAPTEADLDVDHLESVSQCLEALEEAGYPEAVDFGEQQLRFDLCHGCRTRYLRDPLGKDNAQKFHFSEN